MKKYLSGFLTMLMVLGMSAASYAQGPELVARKRVAVADFTIRQNSVLWGQEAYEFARTSTEKIINAFSSLKRFSILDRTAVSRLQEEKQIQMLGYSAESQQVNLGAVGSADIYCTGEVQNVSVTQKYDNNGNFLGYDGDVELQMKLYDLNSGTLVLSKDVRGGTEMGGGLLSILNVYQDTPSKAVFKALNNAERRIKDAIEEAFPVEGVIAEVVGAEPQNERFLVTLGSDLGFRKGDQLIVIEISSLVVNGVKYPRQKEIGRAEIVRTEPDGMFSEVRMDGEGGQLIVKKHESGYNLVLRSLKR